MILQHLSEVDGALILELLDLHVGLALLLLRHELDHVGHEGGPRLRHRRRVLHRHRKVVPLRGEPVQARGVP